MSTNHFSHNETNEFIDIDAIKSDISNNFVLNKFKASLIGLTGSIATGKTTVAEMFREYGVEIIDFDILSRKAVEPGTKSISDIVAYFGSNVLDKNGRLDRKALSNIVFKEPHKRRELERLIHPEIFKLFCKELKKISKQNYNNTKVIIAVIPILIEMNLQILFDKIIVVYLPYEIQLQRLMKRENIDNEKANNIIKSQLPIEQKVKYADFLINNINNLEDTRKQVKDVWKNLLQ